MLKKGKWLLLVTVVVISVISILVYFYASKEKMTNIPQGIDKEIPVNLTKSLEEMIKINMSDKPEKIVELSESLVMTEVKSWGDYYGTSEEVEGVPDMTCTFMLGNVVTIKNRGLQAQELTKEQFVIEVNGGEEVIAATNEVSISGNEGVFVRTTFPLQLEPNEEKEIYIMFNPTFSGKRFESRPTPEETTQYEYEVKYFYQDAIGKTEIFQDIKNNQTVECVVYRDNSAKQ